MCDLAHGGGGCAGNSYHNNVTKNTQKFKLDQAPPIHQLLCAPYLFQGREKKPVTQTDKQTNKQTENCIEHVLYQFDG